MIDEPTEAKSVTLEDIADAVMTLPIGKASATAFYHEGKYCGYGWAAHHLFAWNGGDELPEELRKPVRDAGDRGFDMNGMVFTGAYYRAEGQGLSHAQCVEAAKRALAERLREAARGR